MSAFIQICWIPTVVNVTFICQFENKKGCKMDKMALELTFCLMRLLDVIALADIKSV